METPSLNNELNRHNPPPIAFTFGKCLKNHAATTGGYNLDGCLEFMPLPAPISTPTDLKCDACGCHRNFHHLEVDQLKSPPPSSLVVMANNTGRTPESPSPPPISSSYYPAPPHMFFAFNPGFPAPEPADEINRPSGSNHGRKKRFRSKFSEDQKAKMQEFAERIGWKMVKSEEETIVGFCNQIGVDEGVFKVWMHNHKNISIRDNYHRNRRDDGANGLSSSS